MQRPDRNDESRPQHGVWTHWLVLAGSLALTAAATAFVFVGTRGHDAARFDNAVQSAYDRVSGRLDIYISTLRGGAALFAAADTVTAETFQQYVERLEVQRRYPGIQGVGWTQRMAYDPAAPVDEQHAIQYLQPLDRRNQAALGYDMYSEPTRREAMRRARDDAEPALSGMVTLVQEIVGPQQPGFLLYVPVYENGVIPATLSGRRSALLGFVYSPFRAHDLFDGIFGSEQHPRVSFSVYDGLGVDPDRLLHASERAPSHRPAQRARGTITIAGHHWTVVYESQPEFEAASTRRLVPLVFLAGLLASGLLFWLAREQFRARATAEAASQAKSRFLAVMSHELRTPLNAIGGYVDLMQLGIAGPTTARQDEYLARIHRSQQHLLGLINDVLNFARLDAGRVEYRSEPVRIGAVVSEAESIIAPLAQQKGLRFAVRGGPDVAGRGDGEKIRQILLNLLSNAVKFTDRGGVIEASWATRDGRVEVSIRDTGIGIAEDRMDSIFDPFLQVDADLTRMRQGTGLGLSIARELARGMDGDIAARSRPGTGSVFTLDLPVYGRASHPDAQRDPDEQRPDPLPHPDAQRDPDEQRPDPLPHPDAQRDPDEQRPDPLPHPDAQRDPDEQRPDPLPQPPETAGTRGDGGRAPPC
jgi:signal transduction histidine kinase